MIHSLTGCFGQERHVQFMFVILTCRSNGEEAVTKHCIKWLRDALVFKSVFFLFFVLFGRKLFAYFQWLAYAINLTAYSCTGDGNLSVLGVAWRQYPVAPLNSCQDNARQRSTGGLFLSCHCTKKYWENQFTVKHTDPLTCIKMHISGPGKFYFKSVIGLNAAEI